MAIGSATAMGTGWATAQQGLGMAAITWRMLASTAGTPGADMAGADSDNLLPFPIGAPR
jgi:hypothetical protein